MLGGVRDVPTHLDVLVVDGNDREMTDLTGCRDGVDLVGFGKPPRIRNIATGRLKVPTTSYYLLYSP